MITLEKAVDILQRQSDNKGLYPKNCLDFGDFWMFVMCVPGEKESEVILSGTKFPIVYKDDGDYDLYDITTDIEAYHNATKIF